MFVHVGWTAHLIEGALYLPSAAPLLHALQVWEVGGGCGLWRVAYLQELVILMPVIMCFAYFWCASVQTGRVNKRMTANMSEGPLCCFWALEIPVCTGGGFIWVCMWLSWGGVGGEEGYEGKAPDSQECQYTGNGRRLWSKLRFIFIPLVLSDTHPSQHLPLDPNKGGGGSGKGFHVGRGEGVVSTLRGLERELPLPTRAQVSLLSLKESAGMKRRSLMERNNR